MLIKVFFQRLLQLVPVLLGVSIVTFLILHLAPGDPLVLMLPPDASLEVREMVSERLGLDKPLPVQYVIWLGKMVVGDMGKSYYSNRPVIDEITARFPNTVILAVSSLAFATIVGTLLGILAALRRGTIVDRVAMVVAVFGWSMPPFWIGLLLIIFFGVNLGWLPTSGMISATAAKGSLLDISKHLILPSLTLGLRHMSYVARLTRSSMLDVLGDDYVRTARAKGLRDRVVIGRHALRNALIPLVTVFGVAAGRLLGGAVVVETVFGWPGLGLLVVQGILARDFPLVQGSIMVIAATFVGVNLLVDLTYSWIDPRIRHA